MSSSFSPGVSPRPPLKEMSRDELHTWLLTTRAQLQAHMQWERAYLHRRAIRGMQTSTDDMGQRGFAVETDLLALLEEMLHEVQTNEEGGRDAT